MFRLSKDGLLWFSFCDIKKKKKKKKTKKKQKKNNSTFNETKAENLEVIFYVVQYFKGA